MFTPFLIRTRRIAIRTCLAVMPLGVALPEDKPGELTLGVHGGAGQVVTVVRDCSGKALSSRAHPLKEVSGSVQYSRKVSDSAFIVVGIRAGQIGVDNLLSYSFDPAGPTESATSVTYQYYNPHISIEGLLAGFGIGYVGGDLPGVFDEIENQISFSSHLRLGRSVGKYFLISMNENEPLVSAGGPFNMGMGYPISTRGRGFTGVSAAFYDGLGFAQHFEIGLTDALLLDLGFRLGQAHSEFDGAASIGFQYRIPTN